MQLGWREAVSNLAAFTVLFTSQLSSGRCRNLNKMKEAAVAEVNSLVQFYAGWQSKYRSKMTMWLAASAGHPPHSFVLSLSQ